MQNNQPDNKSNNELNDNNQQFDVTTCALSGSNLLEASAGTGKTFSLSFLYLRLIIENNLLVEDILVSTFTKAAASELKSRIYDFIDQAELYLFKHYSSDNSLLIAANKNEPENKAKDESNQITSYLSQQIEKIGFDTVIMRLRLAKSSFDMAQIYTIDGFASSLLRTHYLDIGAYLPEDILDETNQVMFLDKIITELVSSDNFAEVLLQADAQNLKDSEISAIANDSLINLIVSERQELVPNLLDILQNEYLANKVNFIKKLNKIIDDYALFQASNLEYLKKYQDIIYYDKLVDYDKLVAKIESVIKNEQNQHISFEKQICEAIADGKLNGNSYKLDFISAQCQLLKNAEFFSQDDKNLTKAIKLFSNNFILEKVNTKYQDSFTINNQLFKLFDDLYIAKEQLVNRQKLLIRRSLLAFSRLITDKFVAIKQQALIYSYKDIMLLVATAARNNQITTKMQAALIDEAQDSNPYQLEIFRILFNKPKQICFYVGDPKQAIYRFRGGDIYAYLSIKDFVAKHYQLTTNYRSTQALNDCVNYIFNKNNPFLESRIDYVNVAANITNDFVDDGDKSLEIYHYNKNSKNKDYIEAQSCALTIIELLARKISYQKGENRNIIKHKDIAILVQNRKQANKVKKELAKLGISASTTGDSEIYKTKECYYLYLLITALFQPNENNIKTLLITPLFRYEINELADDIINHYLSILISYQELFNNEGLALCLAKLMRDEKILGNLLQQFDGRRSVTNFIHIIDLIGDIVAKNPMSLLGLIYYLENQIQLHSDFELKLDDEKSITIQTIHKSKGLDYPIVLLPYFDSLPSKNNSESLKIFNSNKTKKAWFKHENIAELDQLADIEESSESLRVAYVALTRAKYKNIVFVDDSKNPSANTLWRNLLRDKSDLLTQDFVHNHEILKPTSLLNNNLEPEQNCKYIARNLTKVHKLQWVLESFSGLSKYQHHDIVLDDAAINLHKYNNQELQPVSNLSDTIPSVWINYPKGAQAGTALHEIFELYMATRVGIDSHITTVLDKYQFDNVINSELANIISAITNKKLTINPQNSHNTNSPNNSELSFCLNDISVDAQSIEMAFFIKMEADNRKKLYDKFGIANYNIDCKGFLHGFIDLMFYHQGKYYLLDYKSNYLGDKFSDYQDENLHNSMLEHQYYQQATIYTLALVKHLKNHLPKFDYDVDFAGVYYLFLRGIDIKNNNNNAGIFFYKPEKKLIESLL